MKRRDFLKLAAAELGSCFIGAKAAAPLTFDEPITTKIHDEIA